MAYPQLSIQKTRQKLLRNQIHALRPDGQRHGPLSWRSSNKFLRHNQNFFCIAESRLPGASIQFDGIGCKHMIFSIGLEVYGCDNNRNAGFAREEDMMHRQRRRTAKETRTDSWLLDRPVNACQGHATAL